MTDFIEINTEKKTVRKFGGCDDRKEAEKHVLSYNGLTIFEYKFIEEFKDDIDSFLEDLGMSHFKKIGKLAEGADRDVAEKSAGTTPRSEISD